MDAAFLLQCFVATNLLASAISYVQDGFGLENDYDDDDCDCNDDDGGGGTPFSEVWPLLIALVAVIGLVVVLIVACGRRCRLRKRRPRIEQNATGSYHRTNATGLPDPCPPDRGLAGVWSVQMDTVPAVTSPDSSQPKPPPPYCEDPPSYDDVTKGTFPPEGGFDEDVRMSENSRSTDDLRVLPPKASGSLLDDGEAHRRGVQPADQSPSGDVTRDDDVTSGDVPRQNTTVGDEVALGGMAGVRY